LRRAAPHRKLSLFVILPVSRQEQRVNGLARVRMLMIVDRSSDSPLGPAYFVRALSWLCRDYVILSSLCPNDGT